MSHYKAIQRGEIGRLRSDEAGGSTISGELLLFTVKKQKIARPFRENFVPLRHI